MDISQQKEQFSIAFVSAIAAQAGLNNARPSVDDDSVDLILIGKGYSGAYRNPKLELQLKCTSQDVIKNNVIKFQLSKKNYDDLRGDNVICPRYLFVLVVPENIEDWTEIVENELILRNSCYWISLRNSPESANTSKITVEIPLEQKLTREKLLELMNDASKGEYQ